MLSEVPEGWTLSPLAKLLQPSLFIDGDWVESKDQSPDGDVRLIQLADIGDGYFIDKSDRHLTKHAAIRLKCTFLKKGDLLVARMPEPLGRCCVFPLNGEERFVTVVDVAVMRPHYNFNSIWLMNLVNSGYARKFIEDNAGGTTRKRISRKNLGRLPLPIPPINEQHRIAEILASVDASIQTTQVVIEQAERVKRGLMEELLTGGLGSEAIERGEVPEGWQQVPLSELLQVMRNGFSCKQEKSSLEGYVPVSRIETISTGSIDATRVGYVPYEKKLERYRIEKGDILFSHINSIEHIAKIAFAEEEQSFFHAMNLLLLRADSSKVIPFYLAEILRWERTRSYFREHCKRAVNQVSLNQKNIGGYELPLPPLKEQQRIAEILSCADDFIGKQKSIVEQQARTKKGLMDDLLTGKVRTV